jgi:hypothetical protein
MLWIFLYHVLRFILLAPVWLACWLFLPPKRFEALVPSSARCAVGDHDLKWLADSHDRACARCQHVVPFSYP